MRGFYRNKDRHVPLVVLLVISLTLPYQAPAAPAEPEVPRQTQYLSHKAALLQDYHNIATQLHHNHDAFVVQSHVAGKSARGTVRGLLPYSFAAVQQVMSSPSSWCQAIILHVNVKACITTQAPPNDTRLTVYIGRTSYAPPEQATAIRYTYRIRVTQPDFIHVALRAPTGPMNTANYAIDIQAIAVGDSHSFVHLTYTMELGFMARTLLRTYLATVGRNKVGFTLHASGDSQPPQYIGGIAGVVERNTMRYFFAFESYMASRNAPAELRFLRSMQRWHDFTRKYKRQLYEIDQPTYIAQKTREQRNQRLLQGTR
jgi:hypothetical protein